MNTILRRLVFAAAILLEAGSAGATTIVSLAVDPTQSVVAPAVGAAESVSGTITLRIGSLPTLANTAFDVIGLSLTTSGGNTISLDPNIANPGLGVLTPGGGFLIPSLFVRLVQGSTALDFSIPDVTGSVAFGPGGASIALASTSFALAVSGPSGDVTVMLRAVPEPSVALLAAGGLALLACAARRTVRTAEISR